MKININSNQVPFKEIEEGNLFVHGTSLMLKRIHLSLGEHYTACKVGVEYGGYNVKDDVLVTPVVEVSVKL